MNDMRWECGKDGCFNVLRRLKFHVFDSCFPGRINFTDVDGLVEVNGHFLGLEWKSGDGRGLSTGQRLCYEQLTRFPRFVMVLVRGNAKDMSVEEFCVIQNGSLGGWESGDLAALKGRIQRWARRVRRLPRVA